MPLRPADLLDIEKMKRFNEMTDKDLLEVPLSQVGDGTICIRGTRDGIKRAAQQKKSALA